MSREDAVVLREASTDDYPAARRLIATAFAGEPFAVGMFGESRLDRFVGMAHEYDSWPSASNAIVVAAEASGTLVGVALATHPGECPLCDAFDESAFPRSTNAQRIEYQFQSECRNAHLSARLPPHAHIGTVATDPFLNGCGIGRRVLGELVERLVKAGVTCVALECLTTRERFYTNAGFRRVVEFDDPGGPGLRTVLMRIDLASA